MTAIYGKIGSRNYGYNDKQLQLGWWESENKDNENENKTSDSLHGAAVC